MRRFVRIGLGCVLVALWASVLIFGAQCGGVRSHTVRLHVLAHDDTPAEQALKLQVRDAVNAYVTPLLEGVSDRAAALAVLDAALPQLQQVAQACVAAAGYTHPVTVERTAMYFTTRTYDSGTLPAGRYEALRVRIGDATGRNWWCVVYPPLCVSAAAAQQLPDSDRAVIRTPRYAVRFKLVEWWEALQNRK